MIRVQKGEVYGRWVVLDILPKRRNNALVQCACGTISYVPTNALRSGRSSQCIICRRKYVLPKPAEKSVGDKLARNEVWHQYRKSARERGYVFELTKDVFFKKIIEPCFYCGDEGNNKRLSNRRKEWETPFYYTGLDRVDSKKGYTEDNVVPCCIVCNRMKRDLSHQEFLLHLKNIISHIGV